MNLYVAEATYRLDPIAEARGLHLAFRSEEELCMRYCGYWVSLRGMPETPNTATVTVTLPRVNLFTPNALQFIMQLIGEGYKP